MRKGLVLLLLLAVSCRPQADVKSFVSASGGQGDFDHAAWDGLLRGYVTEDGRVDYAQWKKDGSVSLDAYLDQARAARPSDLSRDTSVAFWINVYNALTVRGVLEFYPLKSIKDKVNRLPGGYNIWKDYKITIDSKELSLDDIEHQILRKMDEPRMHFAINCASKGCVRLFNRAYRSKKLDAQLDEAGRAFFADPEKFRIEEGQIHISELFSWFGKDFGKTPKDQLVRVKDLLKPEDREFVEKQASIQFHFIDWDWSLNRK